MVILEENFKDFLMRKRLKTYQKQAEKALKTYQKRYFRLCFKDINVKKSPAARQSFFCTQLGPCEQCLRGISDYCEYVFYRMKVRSRLSQAFSLRKVG